ncbi:MAG TPA: hypothetical protein VLD59_19145 [Steroidobacteraceae bacterium]|nr:hypothetical protein [Steroidobacteraceae bacterium]
MTPVRIRYRFVLPDGRRESFDLKFDPQDFRLLNPQPAELPFWTALDCKQCENCPLKVETHPHCPVAVHLVGIIERLEKLVSYDQVRIDVVTAERTVTHETTAQQALSSLLGLIIATSGCPRTEFLRPMARFHLPFASELETVYRSVSMYALAQLIKAGNGTPPDTSLEGLKKAYGELHRVNRGLAKRIGAATGGDPARNAVALLDAYTTLLPNAIEQALADMRPLFGALLDDAR